MLPNYEIFNEPRNFTKSEKESRIFEFKGEKIGILVCEDAWHDDIPNMLYKKGATLFIIVNASPFDLKKQEKRIDVVNQITNKYKVPVAYLNTLGGYDELIFDGGSFAIDKNQNFLCEPYLWKEGAIRLNTSNNTTCSNIEPISEEENIYQALVLSVKDYFKKNNFTKAVIGLSGGIDSALVANICADALGADKLKCAILPSKFNLEESMEYALELVENIGCEKLTIPIDNLLNNFSTPLKTSLKSEKLKEITMQNLQARIRAVLLMAISNEENSLLLATSNKSESAVGYCTIYGDMCGGFAPIKDLYKTQIYKLAKWRNKNIPKGSLCSKLKIIPNFIIEREPSAELSYNQKDSDKLPPYNTLDKILNDLIELDLPHKKVSEKNNVKLDLVKSIVDMIKNSEYKRSQAPVGPKISTRSFNYDRIYPVTYYTSIV